jgi:hypothetical protein
MVVGCQENLTSQSACWSVKLSPRHGWTENMLTVEYFNPILGSKILSVFSKLSHENRNGRSPYFQLHKKWGISWPADDKVTVSRVELRSMKLVRHDYVKTAFLNTVNKLASTKFINIAFIFYQCILLWYLYIQVIYTDIIIVKY